MTEPEITRLSSTTNAAVVQLPERNYPGVVIQGDSLQNLNSLVLEARRQLKSGDLAECNEVLEELGQLLEGYLHSYREATKTDS